MDSNLEKELHKALDFITADWQMQNNFYDYRSNFIYIVKTVDEVIRMSKSRGISTKYALHRWYNYNTSIYCEQLFVECGATKESDLKNKEIDIFINSVPFDVKVSVYPKALSDHPYDLTTRDGKNEMIRWLYEHQSQQGRKHYKNRLFIICDGKDAEENLRLKSDFEQIRNKIKLFMESTKNGFNKLKVYDHGIEITVTSDIIYITSNKNS